MVEIGRTYQQLLNRKIHPKRPRIPFFSSVTKGALTEASEFSSEYWQANLESPVLFREAVTALMTNVANEPVFVEVGPSPTLAGPLQQMIADSKSSASYVPTLEREKDSHNSLLTTIGKLWLHGLPIIFDSLMPHGNVLTDLPSYPWSHGTSHWNESRISRSWRFRECSHHELLGSRVVETTDTEPVWRNMLHLDDVPWLRDHKIHSDVVLPFAAYLNMAVEAVRQMTGSEDHFSLRNCRVTTAMLLQDSKPTEIVTSVRSLRLTDQTESTWVEFTVSTHTGTKWVKHCVGQIQPGQGNIKHLADIVTYPRVVSSDAWYKVLKVVGLNYGPSFSLLSKISASVVECFAAAVIEHEDLPHTSGYLLHPAAIDQFLQLMTVAVAQGQARKLGTLVLPTAFHEIEIRNAASTIHLSVSSLRHQGREYVGDVSGIDSHGNLALSMKGITLSPVPEDLSRESEDPHAMCRLIWNPAIDFLDPKILLRTLSTRQEGMRLIERLGALCILEIAEKLDPGKLSSSHLNNYGRWIENQKQALLEGSYPNIVDGPNLAAMNAKERLPLVQSLSEAIRTFPRTYQTTVAMLAVYSGADTILSGELDPLTLLLQNDNLALLYEEMYNVDQSALLHALGHNNPCMRVLEIGAGTGGTTRHILDGLVNANGGAFYSTYVYTDVSAGFFPAATKMFRMATNIEYKILDISKDPLEQGFAAGSFDLVVASNVVHVTPSLVRTLQNIKTIMKPNGRLLLGELCPTGVWVNVIFGLLPGWWNGTEDGRIDEPYVSTERWERELHSAGFEGLDTIFHDDAGDARINALMIARPRSSMPLTKKVALLVENEADLTGNCLQHMFSNARYEVRLFTLDSAWPLDRDVISLLDTHQPFLSTMGASDFQALQKLLSELGSQGYGMLWATRPCSVNANDPNYAQILGFSRVIRAEAIASFATFQITVADLEDSTALLQVFEQFSSRDNESWDIEPDFEYLFHNKRVYTGRFHPVTYKTEMLQHAKLRGSARLSVGEYASISTLQWIGCDVVDLGPDDVEIEMDTIGMNFKASLSRTGKIFEMLTDMSIGPSHHTRISLCESCWLGDRRCWHCESHWFTRGRSGCWRQGNVHH